MVGPKLSLTQIQAMVALAGRGRWGGIPDELGITYRCAHALVRRGLAQWGEVNYTTLAPTSLKLTEKGYDALLVEMGRAYERKGK